MTSINSDSFPLYKRECHSPKPPNKQGVPHMATFTFAEAIKIAKTEDEFWNLAVKSGVFITLNTWSNYGYKFENLGES